MRNLWFIAAMLCLCKDGSAESDINRISSALDSATDYVRAHRHDLQSDADLSGLIVVDYLQRRFQLSDDLRWSSESRGAPYEERMRSWGKFVGLDQLQEEGELGELSAPPRIEPMVLRALYCDRFPLPQSFGSLLQQLAERGGYELTHAALALRLLRDNGCSLESTSLDVFIKKRLTILLESRPSDARFEALDVRYEALAMLLDFQRASVDPSQISRLLAEQGADGGWRAEADHGSRMHPTALALWALLTYAYPKAQATSFARPNIALHQHEP